MRVLPSYRFPPRYGPEWGSGGIFGLRYHRGTLYFTLAFEAEAHFVRGDRERVYRYELVGHGPVSGGDTYNAVDAVDSEIFFGGWVHAPAVYQGGGRGRTISFVNKWSHVHVYDTDEDEVRLLWRESIHHPTDWAGEVSNIVYDPVNDRLLLSRADGHANLGVYELGRRGGDAKRLSEYPSLKGTLFLDHACFDIMRSFRVGFEGVQCLDLVEGRWTRQRLLDLAQVSLDGHGVITPLVGAVASAYARLFAFVKGGVVVGNPLEPEREPMRFVRLLDFGFNGYGPLRTVALPLGGGLLVAFNAYTHGLLNPSSEEEKLYAEFLNTIVGPSTLVYIAPSMARIVAGLGARVTSMELVGEKLLLGVDTTANLMRLDATPIDAGERGLVELSASTLLASQPPPLSFSVPGRAIRGVAWGGVPLEGYREPRLVLRLTHRNRLHIYEYDLALPPAHAHEEVVDVPQGRSVVELSGYSGVVSFRFEEDDPGAWIRIELR